MTIEFKMPEMSMNETDDTFKIESGPYEGVTVAFRNMEVGEVLDDGSAMLNYDLHIDDAHSTLDDDPIFQEYCNNIILHAIMRAVEKEKL